MGQGDRRVERSDAEAVGPGVQRRDVGEPHDPLGVGLESGGIEEGEEPGAAVSAAEGPDGSDRRVTEARVEDVRPVGIGAAEGMVAGRETRREDGGEPRGADGLGRLGDSLLRGESRRRHQGDAVPRSQPPRSAPRNRRHALCIHAGKFGKNTGAAVESPIG